MMNIPEPLRTRLEITGIHLRNGRPIEGKTQMTDQELLKASQSVDELSRFFPDDQVEILREIDTLRECIGNVLFPNREDPLGDKGGYYLETVTAHEAALESDARLRRMILGRTQQQSN